MFDHKTGRGRVAAHRGDYFDAIYNKKNKVVLVLVEALGGIIDETLDELGRLARRSKGPGAVDRTPLLVPTMLRCASHAAPFYCSKAAVVFDAKAIKNKGPSLSSSRHATSGQLL
eukprot:scaffold16347_cov138-Isochrysis_galbana.AAC.3